MEYQPSDPDEHGIRRCSSECQQWRHWFDNFTCAVMGNIVTAYSPCELWVRLLASTACQGCGSEKRPGQYICDTCAEWAVLHSPESQS